MAGIIIPDNFRAKLPEGSFVYQLLENAVPILEKDHYFPEYTLHDEDHINAVLEKADQLIPENTRNVLSPQSIEILTGAVLLHDLGMFIKRAGLSRLVFGEHKNRRVEHLDTTTWHDEWRGFYGKALRYTDRQLIALFGSARPVDRLPYDSIPEEDTTWQRFLYGQFIRQNHARLAFDIAQIGMPGDGADYDVFGKCDPGEDKRVLIGLVARSHGMKLRDIEDFRRNYTLTPPDREVPLYYLMSVLRLADLLHVGEKRASRISQMMDTTHSPESRRQFTLNQAIRGEPFMDAQRKSVSITANPDCSSTYEEVENLLHDIQRELDSCWAVLVEKYAYDYELSIHRVTSNLDDEKKVAAFNNRFLTRRAAMSVNQDIVKLLIEPLYDGDPRYGVRELIQNAVDACNERTDIDGTPGRIEIRVDTKNRTFSITDNGIGMNEDVLVNYYLIAGSSYRFSEAWRRKHTDDEGKAKITRSGRFGIGALASFLIGDEVAVTTRHRDDSLGYQFTYSIGPKTLDVIRQDTGIGTKIEIKMNRESLEIFKFPEQPDEDDFIKDHYNYSLKWYKWYHFDKPAIDYYVDGKRIGIRQFIIPGEDVEKDGWFNARTTKLKSMKIKIANDEEELFFHIRTIINGIWINSHSIGIRGHYLSHHGFDGQFKLPTVYLSLVDPDNYLELNLNRSEILTFPEMPRLAEGIFRYCLARLLAYPITDPGEIYYQRLFGHNFALCKDGYTLHSSSLLYHTRQRQAIVIYSFAYGKLGPLFVTETPVVVKGTPENVYDSSYPSGIFRHCWYKGYQWENQFSDLRDWRDNFGTIPIVHHLGNNSYLLTKKGVEAAPPPFGLELSHDVPFIIDYIPESGCKLENNVMLKVLREYLPLDVNGGWIPFDMNKRKELYPRAFKELKRYLEG